MAEAAVPLSPLFRRGCSKTERSPRHKKKPRMDFISCLYGGRKGISLRTRFRLRSSSKSKEEANESLMLRRVASIPFVALHACYSWLVGISGETVSFNYTVFGEGEIEKVRFPPVSTSVIRRAFFGKTTPLFPEEDEGEFYYCPFLRLK